MTISFVGSQAAAAATVTIPTHQIGDLILIFAYRDGSNTAPSTPTAGGTVPTWNLIGSAGGNSNSFNFRWARATATTTTSGTWTNATELVCLVYRNASVGAATPGLGASNIINYPAIALNRTDNTSWVVAVAGHRTATNVDLAPGAMINRVSTGTEAAGHDTNGTVTTWASTNVTVNASSSWRSAVVELRDREVDLITNVGSFTLTGNDKTLSKSVSLNVSNGVFAYNGTTTGLLLNRSLVQQTGTFTLTGNNKILARTVALNVTKGTFTLAGTTTSIDLQRAIVGSTGTFSLFGNNTLLQRTVKIDATTQTYDVAGVNAILLQNRQLVSQTGTFSIAGVDVVLQYNSSGVTFTLDTVVGAYDLASTALTLSKQVFLINQTGTFTVVGNQLGFIRALALHSVPGSFSVAGKDSIFSLTRSFNLTTGTYNVGYVNSDISRFYQINGQAGTYQLNAFGLDYFSTRRLEALPLNVIADFRAVGNFFWYQTTQTIQPVKYKITKRNEWILGRQTHMGRRGL